MSLQRAEIEYPDGVVRTLEFDSSLTDEAIYEFVKKDYLENFVVSEEPPVELPEDPALSLSRPEDDPIPEGVDMYPDPARMPAGMGRDILNAFQTHQADLINQTIPQETPRIPSSMTQAEVEEYLSSAESEQDLQSRFKTLENMLQLEEQEEAMSLPSYVGEGIMDIVKSGTEGIVRGAGYVSDAFDVDKNPVSDYLSSVTDSDFFKRSSGSQLDAIRMQQIMEAADRAYEAEPDIDPDEEGKQTSLSAKARIAREYIRAGSYAPLELGAESLGISTPIIGASMLNPAAGYAVAGTMGLGLARRNIYDAVYSSLLEAGATEADARRVATDSASYVTVDENGNPKLGQNIDQIALSGAAMIGATMLSGGVESVIRSGIAKNISSSLASKIHIPSLKAKAAKAPVQKSLEEMAREYARTSGRGALGEIGKGIIREAPAEIFQGGQEAFAIDLALQRLGKIGFSFVDGIPYYQGKPFGQYPKETQDSLTKEIIRLAKTDPMGRVWGQAALEGVLGAGMGATFAVPAARARLQEAREITKALDELEIGGTDIDPLRDVDVTEEQEVKLREQEEARRQAAAIPREEEDVTSRLDGDDAVDMLPDEEADPLKLELTDPSKEREVLSQDVGELIEGLPKSDTEGSLPDGSPKIEVVNKAIQDVISIVKQGHTLEYGPKQEAQRKAVEEVMGEEAASLYEKTVKERMSYVNSLRGKSSSEMLKNWAKRSAKRISRGLRTHFPQNETFSIEQRGPEIVVVDKSGKVYGKVSTANRDPNEAFELANGLAAELNVESKRRADEWKRTGQPYDPVDTIRVRGEDVSPKDVTGLPKKPKKKNYKNPKYTERQYRVASVMSKVTGDMPARTELEGRSSPMSDKAFENLTKRINDEAAKRLQEQAQEPETPPLRLEEDKLNKKIRSKVKKTLSGYGLDNIGVVLSEELTDIKFDEDGNPIIDLSEEARAETEKEMEGSDDEGSLIAGYKKGPKNAETIAFAVKTISDIVGENATKEQILEAIVGTLNHEVGHALITNDLFTESEYKLLANLAANRKDTPYGKTYLERARDQYKELVEQGREDLLVEEAVVEMLKDGLRLDKDGNFVLRKNWGGKPRSLFNRVYEFFKRLLGLRKDIGFETFDAIITGIQEGVIGSRERGVVRRKRAALREEDRKEAERRLKKPETIPDQPEAGEAPKTILDEIEDALERKEDFPEDYLEADPIPDDRPVFAKGFKQTIEDQITEEEQTLYRLNSEERNDGINYTTRKAAQQSKAISDTQERIANLKEELETENRLKDSRSDAEVEKENYEIVKNLELFNDDLTSFAKGESLQEVLDSMADDSEPLSKDLLKMIDDFDFEKSKPDEDFDIQQMQSEIDKAMQQGMPFDPRTDEEIQTREEKEKTWFAPDEKASFPPQVIIQKGEVFTPLKEKLKKGLEVSEKEILQAAIEYLENNTIMQGPELLYGQIFGENIEKKSILDHLDRYGRLDEKGKRRWTNEEAKNKFNRIIEWRLENEIVIDERGKSGVAEELGIAANTGRTTVEQIKEDLRIFEILVRPQAKKGVSEASFKAKTKEAGKQGFITRVLTYHSTPAKKRIQKFDTEKVDQRESEGQQTGREKAEKLGRQPAAHVGLYLDWVDRWALEAFEERDFEGIPQIYPLFIRANKVFDIRNPEGLLSELDANEYIQRAHQELYDQAGEQARLEYNSQSVRYGLDRPVDEEVVKRKRIGIYLDMVAGDSDRLLQFIRETSAYQEFEKLIKKKSKLYQLLEKKFALVQKQRDEIDEIEEKREEDRYDGDILTLKYSEMYRRNERNFEQMEALDDIFLNGIFSDTRNTEVRMDKIEEALPTFNKYIFPSVTNPFTKTNLSKRAYGRASFRDLEKASELISEAGFDGYFDFEGTHSAPNGLGMYNAKDMKGIFADFKPEAVPEGAAYEDDMMYAKASSLKGFNDRVQTSIPFRQRKIKGVLQPIEYTIGDAEDLIIGLDRARQDPKGLLIGKLAKAARKYNFLSDEIKAQDDEAVLDAFKQHMIDNLIYLYNEMSPEVREIAKRWYDGARKLSEEWAGRYEIEPRQVAAVIANLSPQKDWFMNMSLAERLLDIMSYRQDYEADKAMNDAFKRIVLYTEKGKRILAKDLTKEAKTSKSIWSKIKDKKLSEVKDAVPIRQINLAEAIWVRMYDEAHNPRAYRKMSPDGKILDFQRKQNGEKADIAWGSFTEIAKGIIAAKTPDLEKISISLGKMHKVRNFYNNIIAPDSNFGEVTIDTHAVAAALLKPLSAKSYEVAHNFGSTPSKEVLGMPENVKREGAGGSGVVGSLGTYPIIADAYRDAASQLGILPRQLQSITWEQVRTLFPASFKDEKGNNLAKINKLWDNYASGDISLSDLREEIYGYTKTRRNKPTWTGRSDAGSDVSRGAETYDRQLSSRELPRQGRRRLEERSRSDVDDTPAAFKRKPRDVATPEQLEKNAAKVRDAAEKSKGKYVPRVNVNASLEAQYIANNPDAVDTRDLPDDKTYYSKRDQLQPVEVAKAVDQATGEKQKRESPSQTFFRLLDLNSREQFRYRIDQFRQSTIGQHERLARYHVLSKKLYKHLADVASIDAAMLSERSMNFVGQTLTNGVITYNLNNNGTTKVIPFAIDGKEIGGLLDVHGKLFRNPKTNPYGDLTREAQTYAILKRIERLKAEGKPVPKIDVTLAEFEKGIEKYVDPTTGENILLRWYKEWSAFNEYTIKFMESTGILDKETSKLWRDYSDYIPFYREAEIDGDAIPSNYKTLDQKVFGGMAKIPKLVQLKGSDKRVDIPLLEATYKNMAAAIQMGMKNVAAQRIARDMLELGLANKAPPSVTEKQAYIAEFKVKGKRVRYEILDPLVYESMQGNSISLPTWFRNIFGVPANLFREMITKAVTFMATNIWRDSGSAFVTSSSERFVPVLGAIVNLTKSTKELERLGVVGGFQMDLTRGDDLDQQVRKLMRRQGLYTEGDGPSVWDQFMNIWDKLEVATNRSESVVRRQVYDSVMRRIGNEAEAQKEAIEVLNFARHGNNPILKMWATANPFFNARIQGLDRTYKAHRGTTRPSDRRSQKAAVASTFVHSAILLTTTILYYMMVRDEEWYEELREDQKYLRYYFPNEDGRPFTLPIMFEIGLLYKSIPEAIMRWLDGRTTSKEALEHMGRQVKETFKVDPFGAQTFKPLIEVAKNKDSFTGMEIEPYYMRKQKSPLFRKKPSTNLLAVETAEALDQIGVKISPLQVEHLMTGYGGTIGTWGISVVDRVLRSELVTGDKTLVKPAEDFRDGIIAKTFFGKREGSGYVNRFYEMSKYTDQIVGNIDEALREGDLEEYEKRIAGRRGIYLAGKTPPVEGMVNVKTVKKYLQDIRDIEKVIYSSDISAQEKQKQLDEVRKERNDYLVEVLPRIQEEYGFDLVELIEPTYITDPERIAEDRKRVGF